MRRMTRTEGSAFRARWAVVNAAEVAELRATSRETKMHQLIALMSSAKQMGWDESPAAEEADVRKRWMKLRRAARG